MLSEYAPAVAGNPGQSVLAGRLNVRVSPSAKLGSWKPSETATRVSTMRQGAMATKGTGEDGRVCALAVIPSAEASILPSGVPSAAALGGVQYGAAVQLTSGGFVGSAGCANATEARTRAATATSAPILIFTMSSSLC